MKDFLDKLQFALYAPDDGGDGGQSGGEPSDPPAGNPPQDPQPPKGDDGGDDEKYVPQSKVDDIVQKRLAREREKYADYDDLKTKLSEYEKAEDERKKAEMTELERLQAEKDEAEKKAQEYESKSSEALEKANQRLIKSEFKLLAKSGQYGIIDDAIDDAFTLADLSAVEIDENGNVTGLDKALDVLKEKKSYLFGGQNYADPSPGNTHPGRDSQDALREKVKSAEEKARQSGRREDRLEAMRLRAQLNDA